MLVTLPLSARVIAVGIAPVYPAEPFRHHGRSINRGPRHHDPGRTGDRTPSFTLTVIEPEESESEGKEG